MDRAHADRLAGWLERGEVRAIDPERIDALRAALDSPDPPVAVGRGGAVIGYDPGPARRRLVTFDRRGDLVAACRWARDDALAAAICRTAHGAWIGVEPGAGHDNAWGQSDRLSRLDGPADWTPRESLTTFQALDYRRLEFIPPLLEPARLPAGAGTAVLNLIAGLMKDQGVARVRYRGPYPTEQLFTALLESFRYQADAGDPLDRFMDGGDLDWVPSPHEIHGVAEGVVVQMRHGIDKVVVDGVAFYRRQWQEVIRREPRVVREDGDRAICSLWALGRPLEDRLVLDRRGALLDRPSPIADASPPSPLPDVWGGALAEVIGRESAPALTEPLHRVLPRLRLEWGAVPGDLLRVTGGTVRISRRLRDAGTTWVREVEGPERARRAIGFVLEVARLIAPTARLLAQEELASLDAPAQARALAAGAAPPGPLPESVGRLLALVAGGGA